MSCGHRLRAGSIEHLAEGDVERTDTAADGGGQRALDADEVLAEGGEGFFGEPVAGLVKSFFTC